jgi:hypothetical protein
MADLPSILGGMAQGFIDFGKGAVDLFGTGGAAIGDLVDTIKTGKVSTKNQDDFRKWLYDTNDVQDAAAKGLGTALNGVQTVTDYIPGIGAVTKNPLFNAGQGALGGLADEFKTYGKDYDLGRAGERAAVSAGAALASGGLGDALKKSASPLLSSGTVQGLARGATGGAITGGGYAAIDGGDVIQSALQGAGTGALIGGATGAIQDFMPRKATYDMALTDEEKAARIKNAQDMLANEQNPERIAELNSQIKDLGGTLADADMAVNSPKLTPGQETYFKDSVMRDSNGSLMPVYHSSPNKFTEFDDARLGNNTSYDNTAFGHFVTNDRDFSSRFRDIDNRGIDGYTMELYADVKNPITHPYQASGKYQGADLDNIVKRYYEATDNPEGLAAIKEWADESGQSLYEAYMDMTVAENPFEAAAAERDLLRNKGYDAVEFVEGLKNELVDGSTDNTPISSYAIFSGNQLKDVNNLAPTDAPDIMASRMTPGEADLARALANQDLSVNNAKIAPGQLGLFDDMPTQTPKTGTRQTSLFDQPQDGLDYYGEDIEAPATTLTNPYAPVDGKLTQAMKDRYWEVMKNADSFGGAIDNELYNKIDQSTLPKGYDKLRQLLDSQMGEDSKVAVELRKGIGTDIPLRADLDKLVEYVYGDEINGKQTFYKDLDESVRLNRKNAPLIGIDAEQAEADAKNSARNKLISRAIEKAERKVIDDVVGSGDSDDILYALQDYRRRGVRTGRAGALDTVLSERLGIAPGNTVKVTNVTDSDRLSSGALGRYARSERNIAVSDMNSPEGKVSTMAHERLHSFQNEARPESAGRYDPEVAEAYKQLQKDLGHYYKSNSEIKKRYKRDVDYWASSGEQESRMFQQYLENKGYTDNSAWRKMGGKADEWGNEINPAFDKFIDKLRDLSKRGVALPAITALLGGGAYMASQNNDKEKEVK